MEFSPKEIAVIKAAVKAEKRNKRVFLTSMLLLIFAITAVVSNWVKPEDFIYIGFLLAFVSIVAPYDGNAPKYGDLVAMLKKRLPEKPSLEKVYQEAVIEHYQNKADN